MLDWQPGIARSLGLLEHALVYHVNIEICRRHCLTPPSIRCRTLGTFDLGRVLLKPLPSAHRQHLGLRRYLHELQLPGVHECANLRGTKPYDLAELFG